MKAYPGLTPEMILYEFSYANLILYSSIIPSIKTGKEKEKEKFNERLDGNNPNLFNDFEGEQVVKKRIR